MHLLSQIIYSCKIFHMFRTVFPSIIRSSKLRIQQMFDIYRCCIRSFVKRYYMFRAVFPTEHCTLVIVVLNSLIYLDGIPSSIMAQRSFSQYMLS